ncbi:DNA-3-methyladenine glycosylase family protein [Aeromicrobium sp.]|uniref:DNA-3-methyladenine glycosylase family protein n=1 Tax=Aeromicrobium sp. TaxID=1871063 RepID=UPI003D6A6547
MTMAPTHRTVAFPSPVDLDRTWSVLQRGPADPTFRRNGRTIWRTSRMESGPVTFAVVQRDRHTIDAEAWGPGSEEMLTTLPQALGSDDDASRFDPVHPAVADAHRRFPGLRVPRTGRVLEALIGAVIEQRVVGKDAFTSWRRLLLRHGDAAPGATPDSMRVFPTPQTWASLPSWEWHRAGVDPQRYRTAQACARVAPQLERVCSRPDDRAAAYRALRSIPGVGVWTAAEVGCRALGDADAVPFGDFHLGHLVGVGLVGRRLHHDDEIAEALEPYRPQRYRAVRLLELSPLVRLERRGPRSPRVDHRAR